MLPHGEAYLYMRQHRLWRRDANGVGSPGADGAAAGRVVDGFVEADFYGGEVVAAAGEGEVLAGEVGVGLGDEREGSCRAGARSGD
jgi:hypothetical protein